MWDQILSGVIGQATQSMNLGNANTEKYAKWLVNLAQNALVKWRVIGSSGLKCSLKLRGQAGEVIACEAPAILVCMVCNQPSCLAHALVSSDGSGVCMGCVEAMKQLRKEPGGSSQDAQTSETKEELEKKYLKVLGVERGCTKDELTTAYKTLAKKHHPDKQRNSSAKKKAHDKMVELNQAFDWLSRNSS
jgi:hypothetical protein